MTAAPDAGRHAIDPPLRRSLRIFELDPQVSRGTPGGLTIDIPNEPNLKPGPTGDRLRVVDYDGVRKRYYEPVDLNDPAILVQTGLTRPRATPASTSRWCTRLRCACSRTSIVPWGGG